MTRNISADNIVPFTVPNPTQKQTRKSVKVSLPSGNEIVIQPRTSAPVQPQQQINTGTANTTVAQQDLDVQANTQTQTQPATNTIQIRQQPVFHHDFPTRPAFTFASLDKITTGTFNVGELRLTKSGELERINNHVKGRSGENTIRLTPQQNYEVRDKVCQSLENEFKGSQMLGSIRSALIGTGYRYQALSRDEIHFLITMLKHERGDIDLPADTYTMDNFNKLHEYKMGNRTFAADVEGTFIKGIREARSKDNDKALRIAQAVSANARQNIITTILSTIKNFILGLFNHDNPPPNQTIDYNNVRHQVNVTYCQSNEDLTMLNSRGRPVGLSMPGLNTIIENTERILKVSDNFNPPSDQPASGDYWQNSKQKIGAEVIKQLKTYHDKHVELNDHPERTPYALMLSLKNRYIEGVSAFLRQTPGSNMCFFNSVVNAMLYTIRKNEAPKIKESPYETKLRNLFSFNGCTLKNKSGKPVTYNYSGLSFWNGKFSLQEQIVANHIDDTNRNLPEGKWDDRLITTTLKMLDLKEASDDDWYNPIAHQNQNQFEDLADKTPPQEKAVEFIKGLKRGSEKNVLFAFMEYDPSKNDSHYYTLCPPKSTNPDDILVHDKKTGAVIGVKVHVISDRADGENGEYEYDKVLSLDKLFGAKIGQLEVTAFKLPDPK